MFITLSKLIEARVPARDVDAFRAHFASCAEVTHSLCVGSSHIVDWRIIAIRVLSEKGLRLFRAACKRIDARHDESFKLAANAHYARCRELLRGPERPHSVTAPVFGLDVYGAQARLRAQYAALFAATYNREIA